MIPWRRHECKSLDSRKWSRVPVSGRLLAFGLYERLCDLIGEHCEWDELAGSRGEPWAVTEIADKTFLSVEETEQVLEQLAEAELIWRDDWRARRAVRIPMLIAYAADWFRRRNARRVHEHFIKYGISLEEFPVPKPVREKLTQAVLPVIAPPESVPAQTRTVALEQAPPTKRYVEDVEDVTKRDGENQEGGSSAKTAADSPAKRIRFDRKTSRAPDGTDRIVGILPEDVGRWKALYPLVDVAASVAACEDWLRSNVRKNVARALKNWLANDQEKAARKQLAVVPGGKESSTDRFRGRSGRAW